MTQHPRHALDARIHSPVRFSLLSLLCSVEDIEFGAARDALEVSDSTLSQATAVLEEAGFLRSERRRGLAAGRVWLRASDEGEAALRGHMATLRRISGM